MSVDVVELTPIERDAFAEIANMGVSRAAASLRQMLGEQVLLSVPAVHIVTSRPRRNWPNAAAAPSWLRFSRPSRARFPGARC